MLWSGDSPALIIFHNSAILVAEMYPLGIDINQSWPSRRCLVPYCMICGATHCLCSSNHPQFEFQVVQGALHHSEGDAFATSSCFDLQSDHQETKDTHLSAGPQETSWRHLEIMADPAGLISCHGTKDDKVKRKEKSPLEKSMNTWVWHKDQIKWVIWGQNYSFCHSYVYSIHHNQK